VPALVDHYLEKIESGGIRIVGALTSETKTLKELLEGLESPERVILMVGPEGDFSAGEYERIFESGFAPVGLGELVLRTETAVIWMAAAVRYQFSHEPYFSGSIVFFSAALAYFLSEDWSD
jgi:16S rRNA (uracil1498-N3)-methyltransferase